MFMGIFRSKLSPVYWLIRFFGKDLAKNGDIDEAHFRMMILPGAGYDMKALCKEGKAIFVNILGIDKTTMEECFAEYNRLAVAAASSESRGWGPSQEAEDLRNFKINCFIFEVTEEEHDEITKYLSGKKVFIIRLDELADIRQMAKEDAEFKLKNRKMQQFIDQAVQELDNSEAVA